MSVSASYSQSQLSVASSIKKKYNKKRSEYVHGDVLYMCYTDLILGKEKRDSTSI